MRKKINIKLFGILSGILALSIPGASMSVYADANDKNFSENNSFSVEKGISIPNLDNIDELTSLLQPTENNTARGTIINDVNSDNNNFKVGDIVTPVEEKNLDEIKEKEKNSSPGTGGSGEKGNESLAPHREFLTFKTKSGKVLHLIIDRDKAENNVQLVTEVSEQDLLNMVLGDNGDRVNAIKEKQKQEAEAKKKLEEEERKRLEKEASSKKKEKGGNGGLFLVLLIAAGLGAGYYFKVYKPKKDKEQNPINNENKEALNNHNEVDEDDDEDNYDGYDEDDDYEEDDYDEEVEDGINNELKSIKNEDEDIDVEEQDNDENIKREDELNK